MRAGYIEHGAPTKFLVLHDVIVDGPGKSPTSAGPSRIQPPSNPSMIVSSMNFTNMSAQGLQTKSDATSRARN